MPYVYMLRCGDGSFYSGWTTDIKKRLQTHQCGRGAKYTRSHLPVALAYVEELPAKNECMQREAALKKLTHAEKSALSAAYLKQARLEAENKEDVN